MRERAEREDEDVAAPATKKKKKKKKRPPRVSVELLPDGGLLKIAPTPGFRDREVEISLLFFGAIFAITFAGTYRGPNGAIVATAICVALVVLLFVTAPTWHVRWTKGGDMVVYKRSARRPKWIGRCGALTIETSRTMKKKKFIGWLKFTPTGAAKHFFPLSDKDVQAMQQAATSAGFAKTNTT